MKIENKRFENIKILLYCTILIMASLLLLKPVVLIADNTQKKVQYLSGFDNDNTVTWDFFCTGGRNSGFWTAIEVPSHWEQQ